MSALESTVVFETSKFWPVAIGFFGLGTGYLVGGGEALFKVPPAARDVERSIPTHLGGLPAGERMIGPWQVLTGLWLMYLAYGVVLNLALGKHWWI